MNVKIILSGLLSLITFFGQAQHIELDYEEGNVKHEKRSERDDGEEDSPFSILQSGFVDVNTFGDMQSSAQLLKIRIGEPGVFSVPLIFYTGVTGSPLGEDKTNQSMISNVLNPISGTFNGSFDAQFKIASLDKYKYTKFKGSIQGGAKVMNGKDSLTNEKISFVSAFANAGLRFQTGAWSSADTSNMGHFWVQAKGFFNYTQDDVMNRLFLGTLDPFQYGFQIDAGIFINKVINLKLNYSNFLNSNSNPLTDKALFKFSIDYTFDKSLKKENDKLRDEVEELRQKIELITD